MEVIGNDLANVNTTAFKGSRALFEDMMSQIVREGVNPIQFGQGVILGSTQMNSAQGSLSATNRPSDLALQGNGYFVVSNGTGYAYTRDGALSVDANGNLVQASTGERVLGWPADAQGNINNTGALTPASTINIPLGTMNAFQATANVAFQGNLNAAATSKQPFSTSLNVFDALGGSHDITITFTPGKAAAGAKASWSWTVTDNGKAVGASGANGNQTLNFDGNGNLLNPAALGKISITTTGSGVAVPISINFSKITQIDANSQVQAISQDGFPPGQLQSFTVGQDGTIVGIFSNGLTRNLAQVAVAQFSNPDGLAQIGGNLFSQTNASGAAEVGSAGQNGAGTVQAGFLEQSNVDLGNEFTNLIIAQRGYQANTKVITTANQMIQDVLNAIQ